MSGDWTEAAAAGRPLPQLSPYWPQCLQDWLHDPTSCPAPGTLQQQSVSRHIERLWMMTSPVYIVSCVLCVISALCPVFRLPSLRPPCRGVCPTLREVSCLTSPRPPSCQWPAASWEWPVESTVAVAEAAAAATDCSMTAAARSTTSQVATVYADTDCTCSVSYRSASLNEDLKIYFLCVSHSHRVKYCLSEPSGSRRPQEFQLSGPSERVPVGHDPTSIHIAVHHRTEMSPDQPSRPPRSHPHPMLLPHIEALPDQPTSPAPHIACSACPCAYLKPTRENPPSHTKTLKCQCISNSLILVKILLRQHRLTIVIPIIIAVGSTIIIPATTFFFLLQLL